jgi:hypothetical protein
LDALTDEKRLEGVRLETDVFLEVPFGVPAISSGRKVLADPQDRRFDARTGILGWMYGYFRKRIYDHGERSTWGRFHFADIRTRPDLTGLPTLEDFKKDMKTRNDLGAMLHRVLYEAPETNRVSKQFHKLRPIYVDRGNDARARASVQGLVKEYLDKRVDSVTKTFSRASQLRESSTLFEDTYYFSVRTIVMDAYLLARILFYMFTTPGTQQGARHYRSVVYAGSKHTEAIHDFFVDYMLATPNSRAQSVSSASTRTTTSTKPITGGRRPGASRCTEIVLDPEVRKLIGPP